MLSALGANGTGYNIVLEDEGNNLGIFHGVGGNISIVDGFGLELGNIDVETSLTAVTLTGDLTDSGVILAPEASLHALATEDGQGNIFIDFLSNQFGVFSASANTISIYHENSLVLGDIEGTNLNTTVEFGGISQLVDSSISAGEVNIILQDGALVSLGGDNIIGFAAISAAGDVSIEQLNITLNN